MPLSRAAVRGPTSFLLHHVRQRMLCHTVVLSAVLMAVGCAVASQYGVKNLVDVLGLRHPSAPQLWGAVALLLGLVAGDHLLWRVAGWVSSYVFVATGASMRLELFDPSGDRFTYQATYTDPTVLTRPFTITIPNRRITDKTPADDWNNLTFPAKHAGTDPIIEAYERVCVEGNGNHGQVAVSSK